MADFFNAIAKNGKAYRTRWVGRTDENYAKYVYCTTDRDGIVQVHKDNGDDYLGDVKKYNDWVAFESCAERTGTQPVQVAPSWKTISNGAYNDKPKESGTYAVRTNGYSNTVLASFDANRGTFTLNGSGFAVTPGQYFSQRITA